MGDYVYPGHLKSKIAVDIKVSYKMLEELKKQGFLENLYEVYCFDCNKSKGIFLESLEEFNPDWYCDFCGKKLSLEENIIVLYKVVKI
ncbi:response regulator [Mediterraneibacter glycyrrhizinilyticus]|uniref:response regulator n=1 Tax=Mediterraneibacter glycyrrhizinilyticus TaxID=342942 RepID=UPI0025AAAA05|nr:response regulator [Mediterraneibacter glycyrrhizinilyticus]MDN0062404.1 response regulator [Mediterraneibacter glycyrrhizinilyticus]